MTTSAAADEPRSPRRPRLAVALGGGGARGWAHIGVMRALKDEYGIEPDIVCGTSIGALVGGAYAADRMDDLADWLVTLRWRDVVSFLDISLSGGFIEGKKLFDFFRDNFTDIRVEDLGMPYAAVATRLDDGQEVWLRSGSLLEAVRASIAVPGFFTPIKADGRWLVDGGLTNPVPVSVCRALGADVVIAVSLNRRSRFKRVQTEVAPLDDAQSVTDGMMKKIKSLIVTRAASLISQSKDDVPSMLNVVAESIDIMQSRIMRSRMAGDPPDVLISPDPGDIGFLEFHRARDALQAGRQAVKYQHRTLGELADALGAGRSG